MLNRCEDITPLNKGILGKAQMKVFALMLVAALALSTAGAQSVAMAGRMQSVTRFCLENPTADCDAAVAALLAELENGEDLNQQLSTFATLLANAADPSLPAEIRSALARALILIAKATPDPALAAQILTIAGVISAGESLLPDLDRLLASPN